MEGRRSQRREVRAQNYSARLSQRERAHLPVLQPREVWALEEARPRSRADCIDGPRPCPFVGCKHNLYADVVGKRGLLKVNFPDLDPTEMGPSCALDVADEGDQTLEQVGALMNITRERVRQIENTVKRKLGPLKKLLMGDE